MTTNDPNNNQAASMPSVAVDQNTGAPAACEQAAPTAADVRAVMRELGKRGGKACQAGRSAAAKSEAGRKAAAARWAKPA